MKVYKEIGASGTDDQKKVGSYRMLKSCNNAELSAWLHGIKIAALPGVFENLANNAKRIVSPERRAAIEDKLMVPIAT